jgi:hypothetical protein
VVREAHEKPLNGLFERQTPRAIVKGWATVEAKPRRMRGKCSQFCAVMRCRAVTEWILECRSAEVAVGLARRSDRPPLETGRAVLDDRYRAAVIHRASRCAASST